MKLYTYAFAILLVGRTAVVVGEEAWWLQAEVKKCSRTCCFPPSWQVHHKALRLCRHFQTLSRRKSVRVPLVYATVRVANLSGQFGHISETSSMSLH